MMDASTGALSRRGFIGGAAAMAVGSIMTTGVAFGPESGSESGSGSGSGSGSVSGSESGSGATDGPALNAVVGHGTAMGKNGELSLKAIFEDGAITDIVIERSHETEGVGQAAQDLLKQIIIDSP